MYIGGATLAAINAGTSLSSLPLTAYFESNNGYVTSTLSYNPVLKTFSNPSFIPGVTQYSNGLAAAQLNLLTLFFRIKSPENNIAIASWNALFKKCNPSAMPGHLIHSDGYDRFE